MAKPVRVVVLGGGMGGMTAAYELARNPDFQVTGVYEMDWRLGGKCASGRSRVPGYGKRVEEHGLHILMGFYDNAFHVLKQVYDEVAASSDGDKILSWDHVFTPVDDATMADPRRDGTWGLWRLGLPPNGKPIGGKPDAKSTHTLFHEAREWLHEIDRDFHAALDQRLKTHPIQWLGRAAGWLHRVLMRSPLGKWEKSLPLQRALLRPLHREVHHRISRAWALAEDHGLLSEPPAAQRSDGAAEESLPLEASDLARHLLILLWVGMANVAGMIRSGIVLPPHDFASIDGHDYRDWLEGQLPIKPPADMGRNSPPLNALYDLAFSHDRTLAAGTSLWVVLRMLLDYKGHLAYRMNGGMGDIVFAPFYYAMKNRGVPIHFFTEVTHIQPNESGDAIQSIGLCRRMQAPKGWDPLEPVLSPHGGTQFCWPAEPSADINPAPTETELVAGEDFDVAVLALPIASMQGLFPDLSKLNPPFQNMLDKLGSIGTQCIQLWLDPSMKDLGWVEAERRKKGKPLLISYTRPFNSWADMFQVLPYEPWPSPEPRTLAYWAEPLEDGEWEGRSPEEVVKENARRFIEGPLREIWTHLDWSDFHDPEDRSGADRLDAQYLRANVVPAQRYTLAEAGGYAHRLPAGGSGFHNVALAGDWVRTVLSAGAFEGATMGGLDAARAIVEGEVHG